MSSRVLSGPGGSPVADWRRCQVGSAPPEGSAAADSIPHLKARVAAMEQQLPAMLEQAKLAGVKDAERAAHERAAREIEAVQARAAKAVDEVLRLRQQMRRKMEEDLVHLAVTVARRILCREVSVDPEALKGVVRSVIDKLDARELHRVRVSSRDAPAIEKALRGMPLPARVEVLADPSLGQGSLILETARGTVDASIETQLEEIDRGFTDLVRRQPD